jgi:hypothetical protein
VTNPGVNLQEKKPLSLNSYPLYRSGDFSVLLIIHGNCSLPVQPLVTSEYPQRFLGLRVRRPSGGPDNDAGGYGNGIHGRKRVERMRL